MPSPLRLIRTLLFLPASNPRAIEKARGLAADLVVLDLEDAVKPEDKAAARTAAAAAAQGFPVPVAIRINSDERWWADDVEAAARSGADYVIVPMTRGPDDVMKAHDATGKPVLAMVEPARG